MIGRLACGGGGWGYHKRWVCPESDVGRFAMIGGFIIKRWVYYGRWVCREGGVIIRWVCRDRWVL